MANDIKSCAQVQEEQKAEDASIRAKEEIIQYSQKRGGQKPDLLLSKWDCSCVVTTYSKTLDKKGSLDIGLKLLKTVSSKPGFLSTGVTSAIFSPGC